MSNFIKTDKLSIMRKELLTLLCKFNFLVLILSLNTTFLFSQNAPQNELFDQNEIFTNVIPNAYVSSVGTVTFLGPLANSARTYQLLIAASQLTNLLNKELMSFTYRIPASATDAWPSSEISFTNYDVYLSQSVSPPNRSLTSFASNSIGVQTQVRSGSLTVPVGAFPSGGAPNSFGFHIEFTTNWMYLGGDLLIEIRHSGFTGTSRSVDAIGTGITGYGTLFSACWAGSYTGTSGSQGNFSVIELRGQDVLSVGDIDKILFSVFPNPANEVLTFQSEIALKNVKIFNIVGQLVLNKYLSNTLEIIDISNLTPAAYIVQLETDLGVKTTKFIKK